MKNILLIVALFLSTVTIAQVGINTQNPQGVFNIDGAKDNSATGAPTATQQLNDFTVLANGSVGIGNTNPSSKSILDLTSTTKGFLLPRLTTAERTAIAPNATTDKGMQVFDTTSNSIWFWNGAIWVENNVKNIYDNNGDISPTAAKTRTVNFTNGGILNFDQNSLVLNATTNKVGIGTAAPIAKLHVNSETFATATINADVEILRLSRPLKPGAKFDNIAKFDIGSYAVLGTSAKTRLDLSLNDDASTTPIHIMSWQGNGNIGLGITSPSQRLDVNGTSLFRKGNNSDTFTFNQFLFGHIGSNLWQHAIKTRHNNGGIQGNAFDFFVWSQTANGTQTTEVGKQHVMSLDGTGKVGIGGITGPVAVIDASSTQGAVATINASRKMLRLSIPTTFNEKVGNVAEFNLGSYAVEGSNARTRLDLTLNDGLDFNTNTVMTWQANGNIGIGTTTPSALLHVNGTGLATAWNTTSDVRLKSNIKTIENASVIILKLRAVSYDKKSSLNKVDNVVINKEIGFIAQEVQKVLPAIVSIGKDEDKTLSINYTSIIPFLVKTIQEQNQSIEELKTQIKEMKLVVEKLQKK